MNTTDKPDGVNPKDLPNRPTLSRPTLPVGTISHGTMQARDLIPAFLDALRACNPDLADKLEDDRPPLAGRYSEELDDWFHEALWTAMEAHAPEGYYFGSHPGDGCDYGIWPIEAEDAQ